MGNIVKMSGIFKSFFGIPVLKNADFELERGEVHAVVGENGAGKSTLMKCLSGIYPYDAGKIFFEGKEIAIHNVQDSLALGIGFIQQEIVLAEQLTAAENIYMGREPINSFGLVDRKTMFESAQQIIDSLDGNFNARLLGSELSAAQKQIIEIAKAVSKNATVIIMDEPTAALSKREVDRLFALIRKLKAQGISFVYISHRMEEIFEIADRITILRDGENRQTLSTSEATTDRLVELMVGYSLLGDYYDGAQRGKSRIGDVILEAEDLTRADGRVDRASFYLRKGEILGFAGLVGSGRTELMEMIFGLCTASAGAVRINGKDTKIRNANDAIKKKMALIPEERKVEGIIPRNTIRFNMTLNILEKFIGAGRYHPSIEKDIVEQYRQQLKIKMDSQETPISYLSGGNQQKVVLAKWLATEPEILILDEPTRGIDVGAKSEIYCLIHKLAQQGVSIIMISSDLQEVINMSDRLYIMCNSRIVGCLNGDELNQEEILRYALGVKNEQEK